MKIKFRKLRKPILLIISYFVVVVQLLSCPTPHGYSMPGFPVLHYLSELAQIHVHWVNDSNHLILCHLLFFLSSIFPSIRVFSNESALRIRWPEYWSFSFSISPPNEYSGLISFRIDSFDLLAVQGLSRVFSSNTVPKYQFSGAQPSLWSNSLVCTWLLEKLCSKEQASFNLMAASPSPVILEPKKIKFVTISTFPPSICHEVMGPDTMILIFF